MLYNNQQEIYHSINMKMNDCMQINRTHVILVHILCAI